MNQLTISLECPRCKNPYDESKFLPRNLGPPCKHVVCDSCVKEILKKMSPSTFTFQCPIQGCYRQIRPESRYISKCFVEDVLTLDSMRKPKTSKPSNPELPNDEIKSLQVKTDLPKNNSIEVVDTQTKGQTEDKPAQTTQEGTISLAKKSEQSTIPDKIANLSDTNDKIVQTASTATQNEKTVQAKDSSNQLEHPTDDITKEPAKQIVSVSSEETSQKQSKSEAVEKIDEPKNVQTVNFDKDNQMTQPNKDEGEIQKEQIKEGKQEENIKNHQNDPIYPNSVAGQNLISNTFVESNNSSPVEIIPIHQQKLDKFAVESPEKGEESQLKTGELLDNLISKDEKDPALNPKVQTEEMNTEDNNFKKPKLSVEQLQAEIIFQNELKCAIKEANSKTPSKESQLPSAKLIVQDGEDEMRQRMTSDIGRTTRKYSTTSQRALNDEKQEALPESTFSPRTTEILNKFNLNASGSIDEVFSATLVQTCNKKVQKSIFDSQAQFNPKNIDHFPKSLDRHESNLRTITIESWLFSRKIVPHFFYNCVQFTRQSSSKGTSLHTVMNTDPILQETLFKITLLKYDSTEGSHFGFCDKNEALSLQENKMRFNPEQPHCYITDGYSKFKVSDTEFSALSWKTTNNSAFQSGDEIYIHVIPKKSVIFFLKRQNISVKYKGFDKFCDIRFFMTIVMRSNEFRFQKLI